MEEMLCDHSLKNKVFIILVVVLDEIKSLSFHIMFYRLFRGVAKYIVYGTFS